MIKNFVSRYYKDSEIEFVKEFVESRGIEYEYEFRGGSSIFSKRRPHHLTIWGTESEIKEFNKFYREEL